MPETYRYLKWSKEENPTWKTGEYTEEIKNADIEHAAIFGVPADEARDFVGYLLEESYLCAKIAKIKAERIREQGIKPLYDRDRHSAMRQVARNKSMEQLREELQSFTLKSKK